ncbi:N-acetylmuramoyl-L-alanine amidase [Streptomyces sp. NBRC 110611]|uniref:N-acetylmuramoyl-L-alanine amidase n=1 Tax=Streptomyces sp. NBRC 110611 TaxID=1621259 RepID=UPI000D15613F|nr:N-acetylmuramoyl-L-alanine amidase [Streptomyces sp. NBRC 110611]
MGQRTRETETKTEAETKTEVEAEADVEAGSAGAGAAGRGSSGVTRRRALWAVGGGLLVTGAAAAFVARDELRQWWWRLPGNDQPREPGAVDHPGARWVPASSWNFRRADRPADYDIDRVVIHVVQGSFATALDVFRDPFHKAAAHYVVRKDGHLAQTVRELDVAFHAGHRGYNERSVGIEHEGYVDRPESFTDAMYASSARLTAGICRRYGFPADREHVVGHVEVPGTDHTDPGRHWDWDRYLRLVRDELRRAPDTD